MASLRWLSFALLALAIVAGAFWALQCQSAAALQQEIELLRDETRVLARLRAENQRLQSEQAPMEELQRLQADRAAIQRLRTEIEGLKTRAEQWTRDMTVAPPAPRPASAPPALALDIGIDAGGTLSLDGNAVDLAQIKQRLAGVDRGERVEIFLVLEKRARTAQLDDIDQSANNIMALAKELGLKMTMGMRPAARIEAGR